MARGHGKTPAWVAMIAAAVLAAGADEASAQAVPYPLKDCQALARDLEKGLPLPAPYEAETRWFREGDLGIKGRQCRISAEGKSSMKDPDEPLAQMDAMIARIIRTLETHGFKKNKMIDRYTRKGKAYRAFAMRKERFTCWTNIEFQDPPETAGAKKPSAVKPAPNWILSVECFKG